MAQTTHLASFGPVLVDTALSIHFRTSFKVYTDPNTIEIH